MDAETHLYRSRLAAMAPAIGRIVAKSTSGAILNCGTCVGLAIGDVKVVATADHVVRGLAKLGSVYMQVIDPTIIAARGVPFRPTEYLLDATTAICLRARTGLDAAAIPAPPALAQRQGCWLRSEVQHDAAREIGRQIAAGNPLPVALFGFPRFSRFTDDTAALDIAGAYPLWASVRDWPSEVVVKRPMVLDVEVPTADSLTADADELGRLITWRIWQMRTMRTPADADKSVLGGYSGGPVLYMDWNGAAVVGLLTDGDLLDWVARAFAVPMDAFIDAIRNAPEWRHLAVGKGGHPT